MRLGYPKHKPCTYGAQIFYVLSCSVDTDNRPNSRRFLMNLCVLLVLSLCALMARPVKAQAEPGDSLAVESPGIRIAKKLGGGVLGGSFGVLVVFIIGENSDPDPDPIAAVAAGPHMALLGCTFGSPIGVSWVDPWDKKILTWAGSMAGWFVGRMALERDTSWPFAPLVGAIIGSELWRKPPQDSQNDRVSVSLVPAPRGGLSAFATLRF